MNDSKRPKIKVVPFLVNLMKSIIKNLHWYLLFALCLPLIWLVLGVCWWRKHLAEQRNRNAIERAAQQEATRVALNTLAENIRKAAEEKYNQVNPEVWPKDEGRPIQFLNEENGWR